MVEGSGDDSGDGGRADEGTILSPNELDITDSEYVEQIDEGRFVVSPETRTGKSGTKGGEQRGSSGNPSAGDAGNSPPSGGQPTPQRGGSGGNPKSGGHAGGKPSGGGHSGSRPSASRGQQGPRRSGRPEPGGGGQLTEEEVRRWLRSKYENSNSKYAFDVTAQFEGKVSQRKLASNDLITVFESLMLWYGQQVESDMPIEEVLGILLMESNVPIRYPPESVQNLVKSTDLGPDDTIADLIEAVQDEDGVKL